jgi:hypothetical protein
LDYGHDIVTSPLFKTSKKVLEMRRRELKQLGKGNRPNRFDPLTQEQEEQLWACGQLGLQSPESLQNTVWFHTTKLMGLRGSHESKQLCWADIHLSCDERGIEYPVFNERETKTRTGNSTHLRAFAPKAYANNSRPEQCPIAAFKMFATKRPLSMCEPLSPFYLSPNHAAKEDQIWYKQQPMGII